MTRHGIALLWGMLLLALLSGCGQGGRDYIETGDLDALRERGVLRLLAPRFDQDPGLVREGIPLQEFREQAETLADSLGLTPRWVYVDRFDQLGVMLNAGKGDLIVTNYSVTASRLKRMAFTTPVAVIKEYLVVPGGLEGQTLDDLGALKIAVPSGTAYAETARRLAKTSPAISVNQLDGDLSDEQLMQGVADGVYAATIVDGNRVDSLLLEFDDLRKGPVVNPRRRIAWAARKENADLRAAINQFIVSHHVAASLQTAQRRDWKAIRQSGVLRVLTSNNPASYFLWRGELMGFDYDLIRHFARQHGLRVRMLVKNSSSALFKALEAGEGDVIAASMTVTEQRKQQGWRFSKRYLEINEQVIGRAEDTPFESVQQLAGRTVAVAPDSAFLDSLNALRERGVDVDIRLEPHTSTEMLIQQVAAGDIDLTMADSHLVALESTYRDDIQPLWTLTGTRDVAWGLRADQPGLVEQLNAYISRNYRGLFYNVTYNRYFKEPKTIRIHEKYRVAAGKAISPYDDLVKKHALEYGLDWRLVLSQMYQESHFNPDARSFAGAQGLMQIMPRTARQFGYDDPHDPEQGVAAGVEYLDWLARRFPQRLELAQRIYFALAAYNAGHGHVEDARRLAQRLGKDPDRWFGNVEEAMLLLSQPRYARQARYGYARGSEPVKYVREIRNRYLGYVEFTEQHRVATEPR